MSRQMDIAYAFLKERILDGTYHPSQKLTEHELSEHIGVSRNTVKKALLKLEQENLIKIETNKGATIKSFTLVEIINILEIREVLEGLAARTAAKNITDDQLKKLEEILNEMSIHLQSGNFDEYSNLNKKFHDVIYNASKNAQAVEMIRVIKTQLSRYQFRTILVPGRSKNSFLEHQKIFEAMKIHDEIKAEEAIKSHTANVRHTIEQNYSYIL